MPAESPTLSPARRRAVMWAACAAVMLVVGMQAAINLAIPSLAAGRLHPSSSSMLWVIDAYVIVFASLLITGGALGDRYGRRLTLVLGVTCFTVGCTASALAPNVGLLLAGRAITGLGAALALPNTLAVIIAVFPAPERPQAIAVWAGVTGFAGVAGNLIAGVVIQLTGVDGLFVTFAVLGALCAVAIAVMTPSVPGHQQRQDVVGAALLTLGLACLVGGIIEGPPKGWGSGVVIGGFAAAVVLLAVFVAWELRRDEPMLDPRVLTIPAVSVGATLMILLFVGVFGLFYVNAQYLEQAKDYTPLQAGLAIAPMALTIGVSARVAGRLVAWMGTRLTVALALGLAATGLLGFSTSSVSTHYLPYIGWLLVFGCGMGFALPLLSQAIVTSMPTHRSGLGSGINGAAREVGSALGVALVGTVLAAHFTSHLPASLRTGADTTSASVLARIHADPALHAHVVDVLTGATSAGVRVIAACTLAGAVLALLGRSALPGRAAT